MKELARNETIGRISLKQGDTLSATYEGRVVASYEIEEEMTVDTLLIVKPEPGELGLSGGIGAVFGQRIKP